MKNEAPVAFGAVPSIQRADASRQIRFRVLEQSPSHSHTFKSRQHLPKQRARSRASARTRPDGCAGVVKPFKRGAAI